MIARRGGKAVALLFCLATVAACTRAQAKVTPDVPLAVPQPPPHDVEVTDTEPPPPLPLVPEPARNTPQRTRTNAPTRPEPARPAAQEPPKVDTPPPVDPPKAEDPPKPVAPPTTLQNTPATAEGEMERSIRASLTKAATDLNRVDYRQLSNDARTQYDTAKRFITQAEQQLRAKNLVFAKTLSDKAAQLAAQLGGR